ncbi:MAG: UDP-N-acetylglucosamine 4,6-dehydratase (inverting) [Deltaproteobacteria bacterium]|nr:UDP-N-acetylglucosamine 4,6-dehydratase (inverting) [Deltaproteobacteria bacterium]
MANGSFDWSNKVVLVTGGTGTFGKAFVRHLLKHHNPHAIRIYSRDEFKQFHMQQEFRDERLRFFIGDVRDGERLIKACRGVDVIVHAAAMKQVPACEYNPFEAVKTNILGATNVIDAALFNEVPKVVALSTDKAVNPVNLYGATKLCSDKLFIHSNAYSGDRSTRFACVRYGNVLGSRGSVIPLFLEQRKSGVITLTDERMTRFWITTEEAVGLVETALHLMQGGEIFVPHIPSMRIVDLAETLAHGCERRVIGIRPGEKLHEVLINEDEGRYTVRYQGIYIVQPAIDLWKSSKYASGEPVEAHFTYASNTNDWWLSGEELKAMLIQQGINI